MAQRVLNIELLRDGHCTPWGFRMAGGADLGTALMIQKVSLGSPSQGELQKGDLILSIAGQDARKLSHQRATDLIMKSGNNLRLVIARVSGSPPTSPTPGLPLLTQPGTAEFFKPLPRTEFHSNARSNIETPYEVDEKAVISNQAYRTLPLITPSLKASKDVPVGSYLRFSQDTSGRSLASKKDPYMLTKVQEAILEAALASPRASISSSSRTSTPDISYPNVTLKQQYNSPINLYSHQAIVETLKEQSTQLAEKSFHDLPRCQTPEKPLDLSKSPTYRLLQEQERMQKELAKEQQPVPTKVHDLQEVPRHNLDGLEDIQQSSSFKVLMATLKHTPSM